MAKIFSYIPSSYKSGTAYTAIPNDANADFDVTRASVANRINQSGLIEEMSAGVPRVDYYLGGCPTLLKEPAATNYIEYSNDFTQWDKFGAQPTITPNADISPSGEMDATMYSNAVANGGIRINTAATGVITSLWVKGTQGEEFKIGSTGLETTHVFSGVWERLYSINPATVTQTSINNFTGTGVDFLMWECQTELGDTMTSNIHTNGSVETREADIITGAEATFDSRQGVMNLRASFIRESNDTQSRMLNLSNGLINHRIEIYAGAGSDSTINIYLENDAETISKVFNIDNTQENEYALKWGQDIVSFKINGIEVLTNESFNTYTLNKLTEVNLADVSGAVNHLYGRVRHINIYDTIDSYDSDFDTYNAMATFAKYTIA